MPLVTCHWSHVIGQLPLLLGSMLFGVTVLMCVTEYFSLFFTGRGMKNGENFKLLYDLADKLGAGGIVVVIPSVIFNIPYDTH